MPITEMQARNAKLPDGKKQIKLHDAGGLYLLVNSSGKYWRCDYRKDGKRKTASLGVYPDVGIKEARGKRDVLRGTLAQGGDPSGKEASPIGRGATFSEMAEAWFEQKSGEVEKTRKIRRGRLDRYILPRIGNKAIDTISRQEILEVVRQAEVRGFIETAHRLKDICSEIFEFSIACGNAHANPAAGIRKALKPLRHKPMASITDPAEIGKLLRCIEGYDGYLATRIALKLAPYWFVRPGVLRTAEWSEFDFEEGYWVIPARKMKGRLEHLVPLARQVVVLIDELKDISGHGRYLFPGIRTDSRPISENTINGALRRLGYTGEEIVGHGFRAMASTRLHELGWNPLVIEKQLAHAERNKVKAVYNRAEYLHERREMMQAWADYIDGLRQQRSVPPSSGVR